MLNNYFTLFYRFFRKNISYSIINVAGLATGICCFLLVIVYVKFETGFDRYHAKLDRIYRVEVSNWAATPAGPGPYLQSNFPQVKSMVRFHRPVRSALIEKENHTIFTESRFFFADPNVFSLFSFRFLKGDPKTALAEPFTLVLTRDVAEKYFGRENPLGKTIRVALYDNHAYKITGVIENVPVQSHFRFDLLASLSSLKGDLNLNEQNLWGAKLMYTYVELDPEADVEPVRQQLGKMYDLNYPEAARAQKHVAAFRPLGEIHLHAHGEKEMEPNSDIKYVYIFLLIAFLVLGTSCMNFVNLATAKAMKRAKEVGVRKALGATRSQLVWQFLNESFWITLLALLVALLITHLLLSPVNNYLGLSLRIHYWGADTILPWLLFILLLVVVLSGLFPAYYLSKFNPVRILKSSGYSESSRTVAGVVRKWLVITQFAISTGLIISAGLIYSQLTYIFQTDTGIDKDQVIVIPTTSQTRKAYPVLQQALLKENAIEQVCASITVPGQRTMIEPFVPEGALQSRYELRAMITDFDFTDTYGLKVTEGRGFSRNFPADTLGAFLINKKAAALFGWRQTEADKAVGKRMEFTNFGKTGHVIGVIEDFNYASLHSAVEPLVIFISPDKSLYSYLSVRFRASQVKQALESIRKVYADLFPGVSLEYEFLDDNFKALYIFETRLLLVLRSLMAVSVILSCIGLFGLASFDVQQKTKQIGIRKIFGASPASIVLLIYKNYFLLISAAFLVSAPLAYFFARRWMQGFAYKADVKALVFLLPFVLVVTIALVTISFQTIKAALKNPVKSLAQE